MAQQTISRVSPSLPTLWSISITPPNQKYLHAIRPYLEPWILTFSPSCVCVRYREAILALWSKSWQIAWTKPSKSGPSCRKISTQWNLSCARCRKKLQKSPVRMSMFQVSFELPKMDRSLKDHQSVTIWLIFWLAELQQDYLAKRELEQLIDETETSFTKINESIKTLICVVQKQEKHLLVKTGSKWIEIAFVQP